MTIRIPATAFLGVFLTACGSKVDLSTKSFTVPMGGGSHDVPVGDGKISFAFPAASGGAKVTLTPATGRSIGWPDTEFEAVIRMEPDGMKFSEPVVIRPSSDELLVLNFPSSATLSAPEALD